MSFLKSWQARLPWLLPILLSLLMVGSSGAQVTTGTILGTVSDPTGAVIPGAIVTALNVDTGFSRNTKTDVAGNYMLANMPIGKYQVKVESEGFKVAQAGPLT